MTKILAPLAFTLLATTALAQPPGATVQMPLEAYAALGARAPAAERGHTRSDVRLRVEVTHDGGEPHATVTARATVRRYGEGLVLVPLPAAGAITRATESGRPVERVHEGGTSFVVLRDGDPHTLEWAYVVRARREGSSWVLELPNPGPGGALEATFDRAVAPRVLPATDAQVETRGAAQQVRATLPTASSVQLVWGGEDAASGHALSEARYEGQLEGDSLRVQATLRVELPGASARVPVLPTGVALRSLTVDGRAAPIATEDGHFVVPVQGRGRHRIELSFVAPVQREDGLPHVDLRVVETPVSAFEVTLEGEREVRVTPAAAVRTTARQGATLAQFFVPMSSAVSIAWSEAVPEQEQDVALRASAEIVHAVLPGDGVLALRAFVGLSISRGAMTQVALRVPAGAQVDDVVVNDAAGRGPAIADWRVTEERGERTLRVYFDREVEDAAHLLVRYERPWASATRTTEPFDVPLLRVLPGGDVDAGEGVHRQRGMVALASVDEQTLEPRAHEHVTPVGANLLPPAIREAIGATVAHTFRYQDEPPRLQAIGAEREPEPARFDAQIDTLVSLGDVSTSVVVRAELDIKSGALEEVALQLPASLHVLEVSAPSLRRSVREGDTLRVELTQPMQGRFSIELLCDRVMGDAADAGTAQRVDVPMLRVVGAEVERGRVGVEALAPFQVDVAEAEQLTPIDAAELPEPLLLRTDNPILHAFRYAGADEPPRFGLAITRHAEVRIASATLDDARYETQVTPDGVAVTTATLLVRNRRQQFLRLRLPAGSEVWSAEVGGRAQTPALESADDDVPVVLLNIVSGDDAFPVTLTYATPVAAIGRFGRVALELPETELVAAETTWSVVLPGGVRFATPDSRLRLLEEATPTTVGQVDGQRYVFGGMFASRGDGPARLSFAYVSGVASPLAHLVSGVGALLLWFGALGLLLLVSGRVPASLAVRVPSYREDTERQVAIGRPMLGVARPYWIAGGLLAGGALLLGLTLGWLAIEGTTAIATSAVVGIGLLGASVRRHLPTWRAQLAGLAPAPVTPHPQPAGAPPLSVVPNAQVHEQHADQDQDQDPDQDQDLELPMSAEDEKDAD